jgi:hypothetical protein
MRLVGINLLATLLLCSLPVASQTGDICPVIPTLASVKTGWSEEKGYSAQNTIAIWFHNQTRKSIRGVEFRLMMLDAVGKAYPAQKLVIAGGTVGPHMGDIVWLDNKDEREAFGAGWEMIEGVEVQVSQVMYSDLSVWKPKRANQCSRKYMNDGYDKAIEAHIKDLCLRDPSSLFCGKKK